VGLDANGRVFLVNGNVEAFQMTEASPEESTDTQATRLVMLMNYVEKTQRPPEKGVTKGQLIHAGYSAEEIQAAHSQGYIDRVPGAPREEYMVGGYSHGSL
jgi:hypothetical protein